MTPLLHQKSPVPGKPDILYFSFQRDKFIYDRKDNTFSRLAYPCDNAALTISDYRNQQGLTDQTIIDEHQWEYGKNHFDIPIPTFRELFAEHAVAPFFVFQLFTVGLWCLDEYWYYSLFTLFMLIVFECTVVFQVSQIGHRSVILPTNDCDTTALHSAKKRSTSSVQCP